MKKLFIAAMALATIVSCSKDDGAAVLESSKKAVEISISNYTPETRVIKAPDETEVVANAKLGTIENLVETDAKNEHIAASAEQLVVLFANNANTVEHAFALKDYETTTGTYLFHNINESVTQVAVVRKVTETKTGNVTTYAYDTDTASDNNSFIGKDLNLFRSAALIEYSDNRAVDYMDLFAVSEKLEDKGTCTLPANDHDGYAAGYTYNLFGATVNLIPMLARVEIINVQCTNLGETTLAASNGEPVSGGYDHLTLGELKFGTNKTYNFNNYVLKGKYCGTAVCDDAEKNYYDAIYDGKANNGKGIVWNIAVNTPYPSVKTVSVTDADGNTTSKEVAGDNALTIKMTPFAHDYKVVNTDKQLSVGFNGASKFEAGKIYRIAIPFTESNLDKSNESICIEVEVLMQNWVVVPITPVFGN